MQLVGCGYSAPAMLKLASCGGGGCSVHLPSTEGTPRPFANDRKKGTVQTILNSFGVVLLWNFLGMKGHDLYILAFYFSFSQIFIVC